MYEIVGYSRKRKAFRIHVQHFCWNEKAIFLDMLFNLADRFVVAVIVYYNSFCRLRHAFKLFTLHCKSRKAWRKVEGVEVDMRKVGDRPPLSTCEWNSETNYINARKVWGFLIADISSHTINIYNILTQFSHNFFFAIELFCLINNPSVKDLGEVSNSLKNIGFSTYVNQNSEI